MAFYIVDLGVREMYGMPLDETKEAIAKLAVDVDFPFDNDQYEADVPLSERIMAEYNKCKERGEVAYFWQFENAITIETGYVVSQNPELFFSIITEEQWQAFRNMVNENNNAVIELAKYDEEMAIVLEIMNQTRVASSDEERSKANVSRESAKQYRIDNKDKYVARRNALLQ